MDSWITREAFSVPVNSSLWQMGMSRTDIVQTLSAIYLVVLVVLLVRAKPWRSGWYR
jgi:hypothetical protein